MSGWHAYSISSDIIQIFCPHTVALLFLADTECWLIYATIKKHQGTESLP
jgi:hypothetical protein